MDVRIYYQKLRQKEREIEAAHVLIISLETPEGGRGGQATEVGRELAARMIVEGRARLATEAEVAAYEAEQERGRLEAEEKALSGRLLVNLVPQMVEPARPRKPAKD